MGAEVDWLSDLAVAVACGFGVGLGLGVGVGFGVGLGFGVGVALGVGEGFGVGVGLGVLALRGNALQRYTVCPEAFLGRLVAFLTGMALPSSITTKEELSEFPDDAWIVPKDIVRESAANESPTASRQSALKGVYGILIMWFYLDSSTA